MTEPVAASPFAADLEPVCARLDARVWEGLRGRSIFITGGTGFVGSWLLDCLLHANRTRGLGLGITALSRDPALFLRAFPHAGADPALRMHEGNVASFNFPAGAFDMAIHAALPVASPQEAGGLLQTAASGAARVVEFAHAKGLHRLLHVSSGAVYGPQPTETARMDENTSWDAEPPANEYTQAKRAEERILGAGNVPRVTARCFALLGPRMPAASGMAAAQFLDQAAQGLPVVVKGDGQAVRSYQYPADLAVWLITLLVLGVPGSVYNVGSEESISIEALARKIANAAHRGSAVQVLGQADSGRAGARYVPDTGRATRDLGLINLFGLDESLARTLRWQVAGGTTIAP